MERITIKLNQLIDYAIEQRNFGREELTIIISGMPSQNTIIKTANNQLIEAYLNRYMKMDLLNNSEERMMIGKGIHGNLIIIDVGYMIRDFRDFITLDIERIGRGIGDILIQMHEKLNIPSEIIHVIGEHMSAHVAGIAGRYYSHSTGEHIRRITGLDPSKIFINQMHSITGLARGDADFVDVIHSSSVGLSMIERCGDIDFYPNGPIEIIEDASNIIEGAIRAIRYYTDTVIPGNEYKYPAILSNSIIDYNNASIKGIGRKKAYMGYPINYNTKGDYILRINIGKAIGNRQTTNTKQIFTRDIQAPWKITYRQ